MQMQNNVIEVELPDLEVWQKDVVNYYLENLNGQKIIIKSVRQCGKSVLALILLMIASFQNNGAISLLVSPVLSLSKKIYDEIYNTCIQLVKKANSVALELTFINNSKIIFKSAEQGDTIRGLTCKKGGILVIDEAAYIDDDLFYSILLPTTNVNNNDIFIFSTPKFQQGFFYNLYMDGLSNANKCKSFDWCKYDLSKYLSEDLLEIYRRQMPKNAYRAEYLGQWITGEGAVFDNFKQCIGEPIYSKKDLLIISVDWSTGSGNDDTVLTTGQLINNKIYVQNILSFNDKNANETIDYIINYVKNLVSDGYKEIMIIAEKNSIGNIFGDILRQKLNEYEDLYNDFDWRNLISLSLNYFNTTNKSKELLVKQLCIMFENILISIPDNEKLMNQLTSYEVKVSASQNLIYNATKNTHDDLVMSLGFLVNYFYKQINK